MRKYETKKKGKKGWFGEKTRHSEAATRGSMNRRKAAAKQKAAAKKLAVQAGSETKEEIKKRDIAISYGGATVEANKSGTGSRVRKAKQNQGPGLT